MESIDPTARLPEDAPMPVKTWNFSKRKKARKIVKKPNKKQSSTWRAHQDANPGVQSNNLAEEKEAATLFRLGTPRQAFIAIS